MVGHIELRRRGQKGENVLGVSGSAWESPEVLFGSGSPEVRKSGSLGRLLNFFFVEDFVAAAERLGPF